MEKTVIQKNMEYVKEMTMLVKQREDVEMSFERFINDYDEESHELLETLSKIVSCSLNVPSTVIYFTDILAMTKKEIVLSLKYDTIRVVCNVPLEYLEQFPSEPFSLRVVRVERCLQGREI